MSTALERRRRPQPRSEATDGQVVARFDVLCSGPRYDVTEHRSLRASHFAVM